MHVHVHQLGCDLDEEHIAGLALAVQHVFVGRADGVADELVAHMAAVDPDVLLVGPRAGGLGQAGAAGQREWPGAVLEGAALGDEVLAEHVGDALLAGRGPPLVDELALMPDREADVGPRQRVAAHGLHAMGQFGRIGLQELAAGGRREEQLAHLDAGAARAGGRLQLAAARVQPVGMGVGGRAAGDGHVRHRRDGGQRLTAKAHGRDRFEVVQVGDLAGRVALEGQRQLGHRDAAAVVLDDDGAHAAGHQLDLDVLRAGVQRVVHQLAHDRGRALDDLAGGDLADQLVGQLADEAGGGDFGQGQLHPRDYRGGAGVTKPSG